MSWLKNWFGKDSCGCCSGSTCVNKLTFGEAFDTKEELLGYLRNVLGDDWESVYELCMKDGEANVERLGDSCSTCCSQKS